MAEPKLCKDCAYHSSQELRLQDLNPAMTTIEHVAIMYEGKLWSLPRPNRHHNIIRVIAACNGVGIKGPNVQGFLTDQGRFVDRKEALQIALAAGQVLNPDDVRGARLYSEDLW
jgi:hypothetical protein